MIVGLIWGWISVSGFSALLLYGASVPVTVINDITEDQCSTIKHFLFYNARGAAEGRNVKFLPPYGKAVVFNNTRYKLACHPIEYGKVDKKPTSVTLPPYEITKVHDEPTYFFETIPDKIMYSSRYSSSGTLRWAILIHGQEMKYKEVFKFIRY